jgi:hypothetical protein
MPVGIPRPWANVLKAVGALADCDSEDDRAWERALVQLEKATKAWARSNGWMPPAHATHRRAPTKG